jgi:Domain of unknown function (DUF4386)
MMEQFAETPRPRARITGVVYLLYFIVAVSGEVFLKGLVIDGDVAATANNIVAHQPLFRMGLATGLIATACYIAVTALLYALFKPVNRSLALLAAFFSLVGCAILAFASLFRFAPLVVLGGGHYLRVFTVEQLQALSALFLELYGVGVNICFVFFGVYCLLIGYLILKSAFLPRILGVLMVFAGLGWLTFLSPTLANSLTPYILLLGFVAELALCLWLLVMGVNLQRWKEQADKRMARPLERAQLICNALDSVTRVRRKEYERRNNETVYRSVAEFQGQDCRCPFSAPRADGNIHRVRCSRKIECCSRHRGRHPRGLLYDRCDAALL